MKSPGYEVTELREVTACASRHCLLDLCATSKSSWITKTALSGARKNVDALSSTAAQHSHQRKQHQQHQPQQHEAASAAEEATCGKAAAEPTAASSSASAWIHRLVPDPATQVRLSDRPMTMHGVHTTKYSCLLYRLVQAKRPKTQNASATNNVTLLRVVSNDIMK